jgi:hypothetical protein
MARRAEGAMTDEQDLEQVAEARAGFRRQLLLADMERMRIPPRYREAHFDGVSAGPHKMELYNYLVALDDMLARGVGLVLHGKNGTGKCLSDREIVVANGRLHRIGSLASPILACSPVEMPVYAGDGHYAVATQVYADGIQPTLCMELSNGLCVTATEEHRVRVWRDSGDAMVRMGDLCEDDFVAVDARCVVSDGDPMRITIGDRDVVIDCDVASMLGWFIAEGRVVNCKNVFSNSNSLATEHVVSVMESLGFCRGRGVVQESGCIDTSIRGGKKLNVFMTALGCGTSESVCICDSLLSSPSSVLRSFMRSLFSGDGSICGCVIEYTSKSQRLVRDLQIVLMAFGVNSTIKPCMKMATNGARIKREYWRLYISGEALVAFEENIGFSDITKDKVELLRVAADKVRSSNVCMTVVPVKKDTINRILMDAGFAIARIEKRGLRYFWGEKLYGLFSSSAKRGVISVSVLKRIVDSLIGIVPGNKDLASLQSLSMSSVRYFKVKSVAQSKKQDVYDFVVPKDHIFWSSGVISHNTSAAVIALKEARRRGNTGLFIEAAALKDIKFGSKGFEGEKLLWERILDVDVLVLDDLGKGVRDKEGAEERLLDDLLRFRGAYCRTTLITTNMSAIPRRRGELSQLEEYLKTSTIHMLSETSVSIAMVGADLREGALDDVVELIFTGDKPR